MHTQASLRSFRRLRACGPAVLALFFALLSGLGPFGLAQARHPDVLVGPETRRPKIGLVLSGGGARGTAHVGVLKELEAARIPIDVITGTSMGAIVGGLYASGMSAAELEKRVLEMDWSTMFAARPPREELSLRRKADDVRLSLPIEFGMREGEFRTPRAAVGSTGLENMLKQLTARLPQTAEFDRLPIPFRAVATDLVTGEAVIHDRGNLADVLRASMSVPGAFAPVEIDGRLLVDGGLVDNLPVELARKLGAEIVIAVNIGTPLLKREEVGSIVGIGLQVINILTEQNVQRSLKALRPQDILITPDLGSITSVDFERGQEAIERGALGARAVQARLASLGLSQDDFRQHVSVRPSLEDGRTIEAVRVEGNQYLGSELITAALEDNLGRPFERRRVERDLAWLMGRGDFERLDYRLVDEAGRSVLLVRATEKPWGPHFFRFGLGLNTDFSGQGQFLLVGSHTRRWLNASGAEWRNEAQIGRVQRLATEFYQPLNAQETFFLSLGAERKRRTAEVSFQTSSGATFRPVAAFVSVDTRAHADLGIAFGRYGELRLGPIFERVSITPSIGPSTLPSFRGLNQSGVRAQLMIDQRDSATFARYGYRLEASLHHTISNMGAKTDSTRHQIMGEYAWTARDFTFDLHLRHARVKGGGRQEFPQYELGGFQQLSGLRTGQLRGDRLFFSRLMAFRRIGKIPGFGDGIYAGGTFELGAAHSADLALDYDRMVKAGSLFIGLDTSIGPLYFGYGRADRKRESFYLYLGKP